MIGNLNNISLPTCVRVYLVEILLIVQFATLYVACIIIYSFSYYLLFILVGPTCVAMKDNKGIVEGYENRFALSYSTSKCNTFLAINRREERRQHMKRREGSGEGGKGEEERRG